MFLIFSLCSFDTFPATTFDLFSFITYFQVCLSVQDVTSNSTATSEKIGATLQEISSNFISAFQNIRKASP